MGSCLNNQKDLYYREPIGFDGQTVNIHQSKKSSQPPPLNVILAQKAMGGSQDIYDTFHSVKRYSPSQQMIPSQPQIPINNPYPQAQNKSINYQLNPYVCESSIINEENKNISSNNNRQQYVSSYHKPNSSSNVQNGMNYSRKYTKQDVNMKMTASQYMEDELISQ